MAPDPRLNLLLTHEAPKTALGQTWYQTLSHLLAPMGVRTFEATSGQEAVDLIEHHPIHLAVVDSRLPAISGINVLKLIQKLREQGAGAGPTPGPTEAPPEQDHPGAKGGSFTLEVNVEQRASGQRRIQVRFDARPADPPGPVVILIAPPQDRRLLEEALRFNAFSVLHEPVDVNLMLETMARALKRFHQNQWPV